MLPILRPMAFSARTADSRPGPGPLMRTSMFFTPHSCAARPQRSAATCAANGVDLREPLKPAWPEVAQASVLPWRSVMVTMVLLNDAWIWAMPSATFFFTFLRARAEAVCCNSWRVGAFLLATRFPFYAASPAGTLSLIAARLAQLLDAEAACKLAVYLHGMAGDLAEADVIAI